MRHLYIIFLFPLFFCRALCADPLSLAELIDIALKNNPETERGWAHVKRAQSLVGVAKSNEYPHLNAKGTLNHAR